MSSIKLPPGIDRNPVSEISTLRQLTIIGANGAGKSRFMTEMISLNEERAFCLNAMRAFFPGSDRREEGNSIDSIYQLSAQRSYMRIDAVSELDKLLYLLFADELESLTEMKRRLRSKKTKGHPELSRLDKVSRDWARLLPGHRICVSRGHLMFGTTAGDDLIEAHSLSRGEKAILYYLGAVTFAPPEAVIFIDSPSLFIHPDLLSRLWNTVESLRPDCTFVYNSVDEDFVSTRSGNGCIWIRRYDSGLHQWDYKVLNPGHLSEEMLSEFAVSRRRVLFIEGDASHSIDKRLYSLVFPDMAVRPLGSCNKVIETTRTMADQKEMHRLQPMGIVDRDRRTEQEVAYLRKKDIMVADVAEIENIFLLPGVIKLMASIRGRDGDKILRRVSHEVIRMFKAQAEQQALQHVRHKVKREVECRIDARFSCITALETHLRGLAGTLQPRKHYNRLREEFAALIRNNDYEGILKVFNHKPMLPDSGVHRLLGYPTKEEYITGVLEALKRSDRNAETLRRTIRYCLHAPEEEERKSDDRN